MARSGTPLIGRNRRAVAAPAPGTSRLPGRCLSADAPLLRFESQKEIQVMLSWALVFAIFAVVAGALGFFALAGVAALIAKVALLVFVVMLIISLINRGGRRGPVV
jgi:uncharacterized membrane protein YtjA (UPF0391 family)